MSNHYDTVRDHFARGGRVGTMNPRASDTSEHPSVVVADQVEVQFQSVLRLRPLSRKEKEDHTVLEGIPAAGKDSVAAAVLHPFVSEDAAVVGTSSMTPRVVQRGLETEYHFNHLLPASADQDKAYYMIGLPMALAAMEPLKAKHHHHGDHNNKTHLVVCMGTSNSGKTYTAFGKSISKRRNADDGLVPRILDSIFSQSKHHMSSSSNKNNHHGEFAIRISLLQVDASTVSPSTSPDDAPIRDLLQQETVPSGGANPARSRSPSPMSRQRSIQTVKAMIANFEKPGSDGSGGTMDLSAIRIEQDETTKDFRVLNATVQTCRDLADAREVVQQGLGRKKRGPFGKTIKGHTLVTLQPVLLEPKTGSVQQYGGMLAILDMASSKRKGSLNGRSAVTMKDNMADNSTLAAVMHCLRTLQHNANVRAGRSPAIDIVNDDDVSVDASEISCVSDWNKDNYQQRQLHLKTVPYRQSKLTMLLQPFFSPRLLETSFQTIVTLMFTAYPGHRDYSEKKSLLNDLELLHGVSLTSTERQQSRPAVAMTGLSERERRPASRTSDPVEPARMLGERSLSNEDQDSVDYDPLPEAVTTRDRPTRTYEMENTEEQPLRVHHSATLPYHNNIPRANAPPSTLMETDSLALSDSMDDDDGMRPPPYAPVLATAPEHPTKTLLNSNKVNVAPPSYSTTPTYDRHVSSPPLSRTTPMDFPGVELPSAGKQLPTVGDATPTQSRSRSPNRQVHFPNLYSSAIPTPTMLHQVAPTQHVHAASPASKSPKQQLPSTNPTRFVTAEPQMITTKSTKMAGPMEPRKEEKAKSAAIPWLANSSPMKSFNKVVNASRMSGIKVLEKMTREPSPVDMHKHRSSSRNQATSSPVVPLQRSSEFDVQDGATKEALIRKIQYLEDHNKDLMKELGEIATRCAKLEEEKNTLAHQLREAHRRRLDSDWTALDEQEWQQSRKHRIDQQQLIRSPLQNHLQNVQSTFQMRNQWLEGGKPHFELFFPGNFRRATALDQRDREAAAVAPEVDQGARAPPCTPLLSVKKRLSQDSHQTDGSNRKRMQLFQQLLESEHRKRLRQGHEN